jgi:hypothetical protein
VLSIASTTNSLSAGISTCGEQSVRTKVMPLSAGAGANVSFTALPE